MLVWSCTTLRNHYKCIVEFESNEVQMHAQTSHSTGVQVPSRGKQFVGYVPHKFVHGAYTSIAHKLHLHLYKCAMIRYTVWIQQKITY